jgi:uncharacterized membrane protein
MIAVQSLRSWFMADRNGIGNKIAPARFLAFLLILILGGLLAAIALDRWTLGAMAGFDVASAVFLLSCIPLLGTHEAAVIRDHATANDANRTLLLVVTGIVLLILLIAIAAELSAIHRQDFVTHRHAAVERRAVPQHARHLAVIADREAA